MSDQKNQRIDQNSNQPTQITEKPKTNYLFLGVIILVFLFVLGVGGYYLGSLGVFKKNKSLDLKTYKSAQYGFAFNYPKTYVISTSSDCISNQAGCVLSLTLNPTNSDYPPKAHFWFLKGIDSVNIPGQISSIRFDQQKRAWVITNLDKPGAPPEVLPVWARTRSGQEIIKSLIGGSQSSSYYFIIPNYEKDEVAIFSVPESYRLRCDLIKDKSQEAECNNFYTSIINQYNKGQPTVDMWLPENYLSSVYSEAENIVKSYTTEESPK